MPKKRSTGDGGLYFDKKRKLWKGVVDLDTWPDGRRRQKTVTSKSQATARDKLEALKAEMVKYGSPLDRTTTLRDWSAHWLETVQRHSLTPNGLKAYESITRKWIVPKLGNKKVADLKPSDIRSVLKAIRDAGLATGTARKAHTVMAGMLESARLDGLAERNVVEDVTPPVVLTKARGALPTEHAFAVLEAAARLEDGTRWWVALLDGLRQSERLGARLDSLDLDAGILNVDWSLVEVNSEHGCGEYDNGWPCGNKRGGSCPDRGLKLPDAFEHIHLWGRLALKRPKSGKSRQAPLVPPLVEALRRYLAATADRPNPYGLIWRKPNGEPYLPGEDNQAWRDLLFDAGIITKEQRKEPKDRKEGTVDIPTTHWARHTTATVMMELGIDTKVIGSVIGHADEKTTRGYQHVSDQLARSASNAVGGHFAKALEG